MSSAARILIVEDEYLLAFDLANILQEHGYEVAGPVPSVIDALTKIEQEHPTAAVLDIQLSNERSYPIADRLVELGVPFLFMTGYLAGELPDHLKDRPLVSKLDGSTRLLEVLNGLLKGDNTKDP
jgi:DNA-binding response OmpR family regulator